MKKQYQNNNIEINRTYLFKTIEENIALFLCIFSNDNTLITREFTNKYLPDARCCILCIDGMANTELLNENIIQPILSSNLNEKIDNQNLLEELQHKVIVSNNIKASRKVDAIVNAIIDGDTVLLLEAADQALIIDSKGWEKRAISEPDSEKVIRGPREGFTESILINLSLIRRKIRNPDLKFKFKEIGSRTHTRTCICYIEGLALNGVLVELEQRLDKIEIDGILDSGYIQELIRDAPFSPFETVGFTERPDVIAGRLLEGRIALVVDGSPFVLSVPYVMAEGAQSSEDYYNNYIFASINRLMRSTASLVSVSTPAIYLAIVTFHQEFLPTPLLLSISSSLQGVPFPTSLSLFFMLLVFDILREAGARMPSSIGQAVNIVGTLVLGQAAVEARLVSAPVVIITALTGITTLLNTSMLGASIILRFFLLIWASILGLYGYFFGVIIILLHLMSIRSFGVPYMLSLTTVKDHNGQDGWIRAPWWSMTLRPKIISARNLVRQSVPKGKRK